MEPFISFVTEHWILCSIFTVGLLALIVNEYFIASASSGNLSTTEALQFINHKEAVVLDIRNAQNFSEGHIIGSLNIPLEVFNKKMGLLEKFKDRPVIVVCAAGQTSQKTVAELKANSFHAMGLSGGISAWRNAGLPLSKH